MTHTAALPATELLERESTLRTPYRRRRPGWRSMALVLPLVFGGVACGDDGEQEAATSTTAKANSGTVSTSSGETTTTTRPDCKHVNPGEEITPTKQENGHVTFQFTDLDDDPNVQVTVRVTKGPGESAEDKEYVGAYCDWEAQQAECKFNDGRRNPYDEVDVPEDVRTSYVKIAGRDHVAGATFIRQPQQVLGMLEDCPTQ